jgi:PAS domain S-box-containing protein
MKENQAYLAEMEEIAQVGIWDWDLSSDHVEVSDGLFRIFGLEPGSVEFSRARFMDLVSPEDRERVAEAIDGALQEKKPYHVQFRIVRPDDSLRWVQSRGRVEYDAEGAPIRLVGIAQDVTDRERNEADLRSSEARFRGLFEQAAVGVAEIETATGRFLRINQKYCDILGRSKQEMEGRAFQEITHPEDLQEDLDNMEALKAGRIREFCMKKRYARPDDSFVWVELTVSPLWEIGQPPDHHVAVVIDITEKERAEENQLEQARNIDLILRSTLDGYILADSDGRILEVNPAYSQMIGYSPEELCSMNIRAIEAQLSPEEIERRIERMVRLGKDRFETNHRRKDGQILDLDVSIGILPGDGGDNVAAFVRDITERKRTREALELSEARFREMAEHIREVFWLFDWADQRVIYASPAYETIWGRSLDDLYQSYDEWGRSVHPEDRAYAQASFERTLETGGGEPREYRIVRPDGAVRHISDRAFLIRDPNGEVERIAGIAEDVTDKKAEEEERRAFDAKMQHAQKLESLGTLAGGIAHDFNNLLMAVLGNADRALAALPPDSPASGFVQKIEKTGRRAAELTNQMLAYSGKGKFLIQPIHLDRLVGEMAHLLETVISKKAELKFSFAPGLPPVLADGNQLSQVVMNLILNASEAFEGQNGTILLNTGMIEPDRDYLAQCYLGEDLPEGRYAYLEVSDTGQGMDDATQEKIFDPFFTTKFAGRGLGLAAVLGIVRGHKGTIYVSSDPGLGSVFRVLLPLAAPSTEWAAPERQIQPEELGGVTVLLVDDDAAVLEISKQMLEGLGLTVLTASNGREGVEVFRSHHGEIALVLLDLTMPEMDGEEALQAMREIHPEVRVLLSSGFGEMHAMSRFAGKGLAGFIQKPYQTAELLAQVEKALKKP